MLGVDGLAETVQIIQRLKPVALPNDFRVMLRLRHCLPGKNERLFRFGNESFWVGGVTQFGVCHPMHERVRFDTEGQDAHFIARQARGSRTDKRVKHPVFAAFSFSQQPLHPLRRKTRAVTKPPVNR